MALKSVMKGRVGRVPPDIPPDKFPLDILWWNVTHTGDSESAEDPDVAGALRASSSVIKKRGIFPKPATNILRAWLFQNLAVSINWRLVGTDTADGSWLYLLWSGSLKSDHK